MRGQRRLDYCIGETVCSYETVRLRGVGDAVILQFESGLSAWITDDFEGGPPAFVTASLLVGETILDVLVSAGDRDNLSNEAWRDGLEVSVKTSSGAIIPVMALPGPTPRSGNPSTMKRRLAKL